MSSLQVRARAAAQVLVDDLTSPTLADADAHHLARVLRLRDGEDVVACDGSGGWRRCSWRTASGTVEAVGEIERDDEPAWLATVWLPALKGERSEWAVTKLTELGVDRIGLLVCDRAAVRLDDESAARVLARWARVAREATCQSRRTRLPELAGPSLAVDATALGAVRCDLDGEDATDDEAVALLVGPEGGWSDAERAASPTSVSLSDTVLRSETAAVAAGVTLTSRRRRWRHDAGSGAQ